MSAAPDELKGAAPAHVVGLWATLNAALALAILIYDPGPLPVVLHLLGTTLVTIYGVAVLLTLRRRGTGPQLRLPYRSVAAGATGVAVLVLCLAWVYGVWVLALLPYPLVVAVIMAVRGERLSAASADASGVPALRAPQSVPVDRAPTSDEVRDRALEIHHAQQRRRRGEAT
jgi:hypothetical protein